MNKYTTILLTLLCFVAPSQVLPKSSDAISHTISASLLGLSFVSLYHLVKHDVHYDKVVRTLLEEEPCSEEERAKIKKLVKRLDFRRVTWGVSFGVLISAFLGKIVIGLMLRTDDLELKQKILKHRCEGAERYNKFIFPRWEEWDRLTFDRVSKIVTTLDGLRPGDAVTAEEHGRMKRQLALASLYFSVPRDPRRPFEGM